VRMRGAVVVAMMLAASSLASAEDQHHHGAGLAAPNDPPITITINPEARVSVALAGALPPPARCGAPAELTVKIVNQGFVTSRLEVSFVGDPPAGATLEFHPEPLKGAAQELRWLHITLTRPGTTDLTIAFKARNEAPDLGGRDRVHFLMRCLYAMHLRSLWVDSPRSSRSGREWPPRMESWHPFEADRRSLCALKVGIMWRRRR
jgi:hypothetical protein